LLLKVFAEPNRNLKTGSGPVIIGPLFNACLMDKIGQNFFKVNQPIAQLKTGKRKMRHI